MVLKFYPKKDTTIYELYPEKNTGLDAILDISKVVSNTNTYNSRVLLDFDYTSISASISSLGKNPNQFSFYLKLYIAEAKEIPTNYSLECYPVAADWTMGIGRYGNSPETKAGASWYYRDSSTNLATSWQTSSYAPLVTASWTENPGGGTWYTSSIALQSFDYTTSDVNLDVTNIIRKVQSGSINFNGFIIKKSDTDEASSDVFNSLKFFSKDTNTVYLPVLEAKYDDAIITGSLSVVNVNDDINPVAINLKKSYSESSSPIIRLSARPKYPTQTFSTSSVYLTRYRFPTGSTYGICSAHTDDMIVDFDTSFTKLSCDNESSYFQLYLDSFQPERYYKILVRVPNSDGVTYEQYDENWIFKVDRSLQRNQTAGQGSGYWNDSNP